MSLKLSKDNSFTDTQTLENFGRNLKNWQRTFLQLSAGQAVSYSEIFASKNIELYNIRTSDAEVYAKLKIPDSFVAFFLQTKVHQKFFTDNHLLQFDEIFTVAPGFSCDIRAEANCEFMMLCVHKDLILHNCSQGLQLTKSNNFIAIKDNQVELLVDALLNMYWPLTINVTNRSIHDGKLLGEFQIILLMTKIFNGCRITSFLNYRRTYSRQRAILAEQLFYNSNRLLNIDQLAKDLRVNSRTMRTCFNELYGMSPKQFNKIMLLNKVRNSIMTHPAKNITYHATSFGFNELGRFAGSYKEFFGEAPKETLLLAQSRLENRKQA